MTLQRKIIFDRIKNERCRQDKIWGDVRENSHSPGTWLLLLLEELEEASKASLLGDDGKYIEELIQVAAVAVAALECIVDDYAEVEEATP